MTPTPDAITSLTAELESTAAIKGQRARYLAKRILATDLVAQDALLGRVQAVYGQAVAKRLNDAFWGQAVARILAAEEGLAHG